MTEQDENNLKEWMSANYYDHLINTVRQIKEYCIKHECENCPFYTHKLPPFTCKIGDGLNYIPEDWEV